MGDFGSDGPGGWDDELASRCWFPAREGTDSFLNGIELRPPDLSDELEQLRGLVAAISASEEVSADVERAVRSVVASLGAPEFSARELDQLAYDAAMINAIISLCDEGFPGETRARLGSPHLVSMWATRLFEEAQQAARRPFRPMSDGRFSVHLKRSDRRVIRRALRRVEGAGRNDDPDERRLFPRPYPDDAEKNDGWDALVRGELIESRAAALAAARQSMDSATIDADELHAVMRCLNDARLVLGTHLDIDEEDHGPAMLRSPVDYRDFERLGYLVSMVVSAINTTL